MNAAKILALASLTVLASCASGPEKKETQSSSCPVTVSSCPGGTLDCSYNVYGCKSCQCTWLTPSNPPPYPGAGSSADQERRARSRTPRP